MAEAIDAVWIDVLPSMKGFGDRIAKDGASEADRGGRGLGKRMSVGLLAGTAAVGAGAAVAVKALYEIGATFDDVSDTIRVGTGATGKSLDSLVASAKNIGTQVPAEFDKIGQVVADVNTRLGLTGPTLEKFSSQVLEASRIMGEEIDVNKLSASFSAFGVKGDKTTKAMDHLFRVSQATGVGMNELASTVSLAAPAMQTLGFSFEQTAGLAGSLDKAGLNSSKVLAGMGKALVEVAKKGEKPKDAFKRVTGEISGFLKKGDDAKAINLASKLFGTRNAPQFVQALKSGAVNMKDLGSVAGMTQDTILGAGKETMDFAEQWQIFKNKVLVKLEPIATKVFGLFSQGMAWLVDNGIPMIEKFGQTMMPTFQRIWAVVQVVFKNVMSFIGTAIAWVQQFWKDNGQRILADFQRIWGQVWTTIQSVLSNVQAIVSSVVGWLVKFWQEHGDQIVSLVKTAWQSVQNAISGALQVIRSIFGVFAGVFTGDWGKAWESLKGVFSGIWKILRAAIDLAVGALATGLSLAWNGMVTLAGKIWGGIVDAFAGPINRVLQFIQENLIDKINGLFEILHIPIHITPIWKESNVGTGQRNAGRLGTSRKLGSRGYAEGGYTGPGGKWQPAGIVHAGEVVWSQADVARFGGVGAVERARLGLYANGGFVKPVNANPGFPYGHYPSGKIHRALDFPVPIGTPVRSAYPGSVLYAGWDSTGYGNVVRTSDKDGAFSIYGHNSRLMVKTGQALNAGQLIALSGSTGNSTGPHLHWARRTSPYNDATAFNPLGSGPGGGNFFTDTVASLLRGGVDSILSVVSAGLSNIPIFGPLMAGVAGRVGQGVVSAGLRLLGMDSGGQSGSDLTPLLFDSGGVLPTGLSVVRNNTGRPEPLARTEELAPVMAALVQTLKSLPRQVRDGALEGTEAGFGFQAREVAIGGR